MIISHKHKFIFISIPKTAGRSIRNVLAPFSDIIGTCSFNNKFDPLRHHTLSKELKIEFDKQKYNWDDYFKFSFVRNPWDRVVSYSQYINKISKLYKTKIGKFKKDIKLEEKNQGIKSIATLKKWELLINRPWGNEYIKFAKFWGRRLIQQGSQSSYIMDNENKLMIDFVGRFENLQEDFDLICQKINLPLQNLPHLNKTNHKHYTSFFDEKSSQIIRDKFKDDVENFNYEFGA